MAQEKVIIKQEPLDIINAAEIADFDDAVAATIITVVGRGAGNKNDIVNNSNLAVGLFSNVTIKTEPNTDCRGEYVENDLGGIIAAQDFLGMKGNELCANDVQVKKEPTDDYSSENVAILSPSLTPFSQEQKTCDGFQVVDEHDNIITISAADLSPENKALELIHKQKVINEINVCLSHNTRPGRFKKNFTCQLCKKRFNQAQAFTYHMEQHGRNFLFCPKKMCDGWFSSLEDCEKHEYESHGIQNLKCNVCNHKFHDFDQLSIHKIKMHSKLHRYLCSLCRDWFISPVELLEHWSSLPERCGRLINIYPFEKQHINEVEVKREPMETGSVLPPTPSEDTDTKVPLNYAVEGDQFSMGEHSSMQPKLKLRLRRQPLSPKRPQKVEEQDDRSLSPPSLPINPNPLGHLLARRITSKFSLKTVPKMFHLANKTNEVEQQRTTLPTIAPQSFKKWQCITKQTQNTACSNDATFKKIKLIQPLTLEQLKSTIPEQINKSDVLSQATSITNILSDDAEQSVNTNKTAFMRQFVLQTVEVPPVDKSVAIAKLEAVAKSNKEVSLTQLLGDVLKDAKNTSTESVPPEPIAKPLVPKEADIKTECIEKIIALQNDDSLSASNFSDNSLGSNSNPAMNSNFENVNGDLPKRSRSLPASSKMEQNIIKSSNGDGYICPKCDRRYSTFSTAQEHLLSNCGRNLRHECDVCHKCFFSISTLNCHRTIHTGELPHKCNYCEKRFRTRGQVTVHHRTHTGERPFVCEICSQGFTHRETLISHLSRHIGMKRYKCYGCQKQFSCISGLSMHRATRQDTCGKYELNTRAIGPRVRVIRGRVVFEPQPNEPEEEEEPINATTHKDTHQLTEVLAEIQNK